MIRRIDLDLSGHRALVTGGTRGIGESIVRALSRCGAAVAINYRESAQKAQSLVEELKSQAQMAVAIRADVVDEQQNVDLIRRAAESLEGPIDILVNNAGGPIRLSSMSEMSMDLWRSAFKLNVTAAMVCSREVMPGMKAAGWGRIINIGSIAGRSGGGAGYGHYAAAKAALISLTKSLAKELGPHGTTVNTISPGVVMTDLHNENFDTPASLEQCRRQTLLQRLGEPADIAGVALFLCSDDAAYITGEHIAVNGGLRLD
jgi:3-oxoacyl-[acyl-carrier protein] reductase